MILDYLFKVLVVAGGGGGAGTISGGRGGGGGGAGEVNFRDSFMLPHSESMEVYIGSGGTGGNGRSGAANPGQPGEPSYVKKSDGTTIIGAAGGGGGGQNANSNATSYLQGNGGNGGGGSSDVNGPHTGGKGIQHDGGSATDQGSGNWGGGGGGGAGEDGGDGSGYNGGDGGDGLNLSSEFGTSVGQSGWFGGGGRGGNGSASNGMGIGNNTGGGGAGESNKNGRGGNTGVVLIAYPTSAPINVVSGGNSTTTFNGFTIQIYTSSGTFEYEPATGEISGKVEQEEGVEGAIVRIFDQESGVYLASTTTDINGDYSFGGLDINKKYHLFIEYEDGPDKFNSRSLWDVEPIDIS